MNKIIKIQVKNHYGNELYYINSEHEQAIMDLTGRVTLSLKDIEALKVLGFSFEVETIKL